MWERLAAGADPATQEADAVLRGSASDLLLYLYRRRCAGALQVAGDVTVAERFALRTGTD